MANVSQLLFSFCACIALGLAYWGPDLPPGPYCGQTSQCCANREDGCSYRILDSLCYCDEFCNQSRTHDDCCPDYPQVCLGLTDPPPNIVEPCRHRGKIFLPGETTQEDCNVWTCEMVSKVKADWKKDSDACIISPEVISGINQDRYSWRAQNYTQFHGKKLKDGIIYKLGTLPLSELTKRMHPIRYDKDISYPTHFDSRQKWNRYISPVLDQGWCGSDWAVSLTGVASDRFAIQSNGAESMVLSPQTLLSCNVRHQQGCHGGRTDVAWNFARSHGLVDLNCLPYTAEMTRCPLKPRGNLIDDRCVPAVRQRTSRYKVGPLTRLKGEKDIMYDIMDSGPVQAIMTVHQDFFHYKDGVYRHTRLGDNDVQGLHSVRIIGWGEERGDKYWLVANSWGPEWGENGYFRIARGSNESGIESFVVSVLCDVTEAYQRK